MFGLGSPLTELDVMNSGHCPFPSTLSRTVSVPQVWPNARERQKRRGDFDYGFRDFSARSAGSLAFGHLVVGQKPSKDGAQWLPSQQARSRTREGKQLESALSFKNTPLCGFL